MASQLSILNHALDLIGETSITSISATTEPAERLLAAWDDTRDAGLRARNWRFSIERTSIAADADEPDWGFTYQYTIAGDVVRVVQVDEYWPGAVLSDLIASDSSAYHIEGDKILCDVASPLKVRWIVNSKAVGLWDACFAKAMACDLADRLSTRFTASEAIKARIKQERRDALIEAARSNALERAPVSPGDGTWMASRQSVA